MDKHSELDSAARRAQVVGYGQTTFGRHEDAGITDSAVDAATSALASAGVGASDVDALFLGTFAGLALGGQAFPAAILAARLALGSTPALAVEGACATGGLAFRQAVAAITAGAVDVALVVGAEKMSGHSTAAVTRTLACANDTGSASYRAGLTFPGFFALVAHRYMHDYGVDRDLLAAVSVKSREHGSRNPNAHFRTRITEQDALLGASRRRPVAPVRLQPDLRRGGRDRRRLP